MLIFSQNGERLIQNHNLNTADVHQHVDNPNLSAFAHYHLIWPVQLTNPNSRFP